MPLILYPPPSISRAIALEALERAGRSWRIVCTSGSLSGLKRRGIGPTRHLRPVRRLVPAGLSELPGSWGLPELGHIEFIVAGNERALRGPANALAAAILNNADRAVRHRGMSELVKTVVSRLQGRILTQLAQFEGGLRDLGQGEASQIK